MIKIIMFLSAMGLVILLVGSSNSLATSGACSYHNGVNCGAGSNLNGNVVCNDGWVNSAVLFSDVDECNACIPPIDYGCTTESDYGLIVSMGINSGRSRYAPEIEVANKTACRNQIIQYQADLLAYNNCISNHSINNDRLKPSISNFDGLCKNQFGENSKASLDNPGYCICLASYEFSPDGTSCIKNITCPANSKKLGLNCVCNDGFIFDGGNCFLKNDSDGCRAKLGEHAVSNRGKITDARCGCEAGYELNASQTGCLKTEVKVVAGRQLFPWEQRVPAKPSQILEEKPVDKPVIKKVNPAQKAVDKPKETFPKESKKEIIKPEEVTISRVSSPIMLIKKTFWEKFLSFLRG